jgi:pyruvate dehydrogenase kinase 2/3/4
MRRMLISRISRRVLVEHHVALTQGLCEQNQDDGNPDAPRHVGIIYTNLSVKESIDKCIRYLKSEEGMYGLRKLEEPALRGTGIWPEIVVDGHLDARFPYIKEHIEYIIFELLRNVRTLSRIPMSGY